MTLNACVNVRTIEIKTNIKGAHTTTMEAVIATSLFLLLIYLIKIREIGSVRLCATLLTNIGLRISINPIQRINKVSVADLRTTENQRDASLKWSILLSASTNSIPTKILTAAILLNSSFLIRPETLTRLYENFTMEVLISETTEQIKEQTTRVDKLGDWKRNKRLTAHTRAVGIARILRSQVKVSAPRSGLEPL
jgi:hypothetical protein